MTAKRPGCVLGFKEQGVRVRTRLNWLWTEFILVDFCGSVAICKYTEN
jgi:hypothetical protein